MYKPASSGSGGGNPPVWRGFNVGASDLNAAVPPADGNAMSMMFDSNGEGEMRGRDNMVRRNVLQGRPHDPVVYTMPMHAEVAQHIELKPVEDVGLLMEKYSRDVAFVLGIPPGYVVSKSNTTSSSEAAQSMMNTGTLSTNAQSICSHLQLLLSDVHEVIYGKPAEFSIVAMPRMSIETVEDIRNLVEAGLMLPEKAVEVMDILLRSQNLPESGAEGGKHARAIQKLVLTKPAASSSSLSSSKKAKKK